MRNAVIRTYDKFENRKRRQVVASTGTTTKTRRFSKNQSWRFTGRTASINQVRANKPKTTNGKVPVDPTNSRRSGAVEPGSMVLPAFTDAPGRLSDRFGRHPVVGSDRRIRLPARGRCAGPSAARI